MAIDEPAAPVAPEAGRPPADGTMVHPVPAPGGWLAERILGSYRAVLAAGLLAAGAPATLPAAVRRLTGRFVDLLTLVPAIAPAMIAPAPRIRRTMHPVH
ncbi:hypothetical protein ACFXA3_21605 [Streptomyces sp. NPDC059456]|uniref:hypothetical protein n=1 Tax=Streptomyces sp. NPDC059456 TaxID=3346838 RepID=UPI0036CCD0BD